MLKFGLVSMKKCIVFLLVITLLSACFYQYQGMACASAVWEDDDPAQEPAPPASDWDSGFNFGDSGESSGNEDPGVVWEDNDSGNSEPAAVWEDPDPVPQEPASTESDWDSGFNFGDTEEKTPEDVPAPVTEDKATDKVDPAAVWEDPDPAPQEPAQSASDWDSDFNLDNQNNAEEEEKPAQECPVHGNHIYNDKGHIELKHYPQGHKTFAKCACGASQYTGFAKYENCCECVGHAWGEAYPENGKLYQKCSRCGEVQEKNHEHVAGELEGTLEELVAISKNHPDHTYTTKCTICGAEMKVNLTCDQSNCGHSKSHQHLTLSTNLLDTKDIFSSCEHLDKLTCSICGKQYPASGWNPNCMQCNPNAFDYSQVQQYQDIGGKYSEIRKTEEFKEKYLYAPDGGIWTADERYLADGYSPYLYSQGFSFVSSAYYLTPEETERLYTFMEERSNDVLVGNICDWLFGIITNGLAAHNGLTEAGKSMAEGTKTFVEIGNYIDGHETDSITISNEDIKDLENMIIGFDDAQEAYIVSDVLGFLGATPVVGTVTMVWQMLSTIDYAGTTNALKDAVKAGEGVVLENSFTYEDPYMLGMEYRKTKKTFKKANIRRWRNYPYMDNNYVLYGTYTKTTE